MVAGAGAGTVAEMIEELGAAVEGVCTGWRGRADDALRATLGHVLPGMVRGLVAGVAAEAEALRHGDGRAVSMAAQRAVQPAGAAFIEGAWQLQGHAEPLPPDQRPCCASCGRRMKLVRADQPRCLIGRCGPYALHRPYYTCDVCGGGYSPGDAAWALGSRAIDPDLQALVARDGVYRAFDAAALKATGAHLQVRIDDNTVHRTTVGIGIVARRQVEARAAGGTRRLGPDPGSDTVLLEVDGGRRGRPGVARGQGGRRGPPGAGTGRGPGDGTRAPTLWAAALHRRHRRRGPVLCAPGAPTGRGCQPPPPANPTHRPAWRRWGVD